MWEKAGVGRGVTRTQAVAFGAGVAALFVALVSPLDALSAELSSAHMVQHMALMMAAAPLLAYGAPLRVMLWAMPLGWRKAVAPGIRRAEEWYAPAYAFWQPAALWTLYALTLWVWHAPSLYHAALTHPIIHEVQHLAFLTTSYLFWQVLFDPVRRLRLSRGGGVLYLFATCLHASALGIYLTLSPRLLYPDYLATTPAWGITPLEDQQLAGLIMWLPGCLVYAVAAAALFSAWLREPLARDGGEMLLPDGAREVTPSPLPELGVSG